MNRDALAFFRILPAGAADVGGDVTREELRAAGAGDWTITARIEDDLSDVFGPAELGPDFDEILPAVERKLAKGERMIEMKFRKSG